MKIFEGVVYFLSIWFLGMSSVISGTAVTFLSFGLAKKLVSE